MIVGTRTVWRGSLGCLLPWFESLYREHIELDADGNAIVPDRPGWGFSFDPAAIARFQD